MDAQLKENRECFDCNASAVEGKACCEKHLVQRRLANRRCRAKRRDEKKCLDCDKLAVDGKSRCEEHLARERNYALKWRKNNEGRRRSKHCKCGELTVEGRVSCENCLAKRRGPARGWARKNKERLNAQRRARRAANPEKTKKACARFNAYRSANRGPQNAYRNEKRRTDLNWKLNHQLGVRMRKLLVGSVGEKAGRHWCDIVGYTVDELRAHIESQFEPWMTWENHGHKTWHIDHIIPLAMFDFERDGLEAIRHAWSLHNLRPLAAQENFSKNARRA